MPERKWKLKSEFEKEDPDFLSDEIVVPTGFMEMVHEFIYNVLLRQPRGGELSLTKFARDYFAELISIIESNTDELESGSTTSSGSSGQAVNENHTQNADLADSTDGPHFTPDMVIKPEGLADVVQGLVHRGLAKHREGTEQEKNRTDGTKLGITKFAFDHFDRIYHSLNGSSSSDVSDGLENTNHNSNTSALKKGISETPPAQTYPERRMGISSENYTPNAAGQWPMVKYPKPEKTMAKLKQLAKNVMPFKNLDDQNLRSVLEVLKPLSVKAGTLVTKEGEEGNEFYFVDSGVFNIYKKSELISTLTQTGSFGELALFYNWPRQATVKADTDGLLWVLDRASYQTINGNIAFQQRRALQQIIGKIEILNLLNPEEIMNLCDAIVIKEFGDGFVIIKQGDEANSMFFVLEGEPVVHITSHFGETQEIQRLKPGSYFGEMALLTKEKRKATVKAAGKVRCGELNVDAFERLLGPCKEIMLRKQNVYKEQANKVFKK